MFTLKALDIKRILFEGIVHHSSERLLLYLACIPINLLEGRIVIVIHEWGRIIRL